MQELVVVSGKGGSGKTSLTAALSYLDQESVICDADVDAADLHLLLAPRVKIGTDFKGGHQAVIDPQACSRCGRCRDLCRFDAIRSVPETSQNGPGCFTVDAISCEGCGVCVDLCPEQAIAFPAKKCGEWFVSDTRFGPMVHARLGIAEENSGKLVTLVRKEAKKLAEKKGIRRLITDGPPGIGCPVIAAMGGATAVLVVAEATLSGLHDTRRAVQLAQNFKVPVMLCINKFDINLDQTKAIEKLARDQQIPVLGRIPFDPIFTKAMVQASTIFEYDPAAETAQVVRGIWQSLAAFMENL